MKILIRWSFIFLLVISDTGYTAPIDSYRNFSFTKSLNEYELSVYVKNESNQDCGLTIYFGDGFKSEPTVVLRNQDIGLVEFKFKYQFREAKGYYVQFQGRNVKGDFFNTELPACVIVSDSQFWVPFNSTISAKDFKFEFILNDPRDQFLSRYMVKNIDGTFSFKPAGADTPNNICFDFIPYTFANLIDDGRRGSDDDNKIMSNVSKVMSSIINIDNENLRDALVNEATDALREMGWKGFVNNDREICRKGEIFAVPAPFKKSIPKISHLFGYSSGSGSGKSVSMRSGTASAPSMSSSGSGGVSLSKPLNILFSIEFNKIEIASKKIKEAKSDSAKALQQTTTDYETANLNKDKTKIGSLFISYNKRPIEKALRFCTAKYSIRESSAFLGYMQFGAEIITDDLKNNFFVKNPRSPSQIDEEPNRKEFNNDFSNVNDLYVYINQNRNCDVVIDYPENIVKIKEAIARDGILSSGYGRIISIDDANDKYANGIGFINHVELIFAKNINADVRQINELKKFGVRNQTEYDNAVKEIVKSGYSPNTDLNTVFVYLKDFSDASDNNISILKQRTQRLEREKLAREAQMREEAKQLAINEAFAQLDEYRYSSRRGAEKSNNVSSSQFEKICAQTVPYVDSLSLQNNFGFNAGQQMAQLWRNMGEIAFKIRDVRWSKPQNICLVSVTAAGFLDGNTINKRFLCEVVVARRKSNSGFYIGELDNCMEAMVY